ncbi:ABC transporter permease subunit/CPBP intramembrane protease [Hyalangium gracile]|uniref:ABC transporter permease subunit/CPBP intramembrane protease n=1 Tax=Hyalangium gracile TaxID=394092 RepID=UPI001CCE2167|nr:ABC transporter permease subunit/CPBP intramembrane protease [Hyalangium gracile]
MRPSIAFTLFRKDLREALRDRRMITLLVIVPLLLYPLLLGLAMLTSGMLSRQSQEKPLKLAVWGPAPALLLEEVAQAERVEWVDRREAVPAQPSPEARALIDARKAQAVLVVTPVPLASGGKNLAVELYFDSGQPGGGLARRRLITVLDAVRLHAVQARFQQAGLAPELAEPLQVKESDYRSTGMWLAWGVPYLLLFALVMSGFYPAIDVTAGEKERGTLQTLLCAPVHPLEVVLGKYGVVSLFTLGGALVNLLGIGLAFLGFAGGTLGRVHVSAGVLVAAFAALIPLGMLVSSMLVAVGVLARTFKEAQNYLTPVLLLVIVAAHGAMMPDVALTPGLALIPFLNMALLLRELLTTGVDVATFSLVFVSTLVWAMAGVLFAARVFESEQVLLSGEKPWRDIFGRKLHRADRLSPGSALLFVVVVLAGSLYTSVLLMRRLPLWGVIAIVQVGLFLVPSVLWVRRSGAELREAFSLRLPTPRGAGALLLLVPGIIGLQVLLNTALRVVSLPGMEEFVRLMDERMKEAAAWPLPLALAVIALAPAICEEAAFRGVVLAGLSRTGSRTVAVVGSALAFGILHMHLVHAVLAAMVGLLLGHVTLRTRSLLAGVLLHLANNATAVLVTRGGVEPAWMSSWMVGLALCAPGLVGLWLLPGASPLEPHEAARPSVPPAPGAPGSTVT